MPAYIYKEVVMNLQRFILKAAHSGGESCRGVCSREGVADCLLLVLSVLWNEGRICPHEQRCKVQAGLSILILRSLCQILGLKHVERL